ncbi:MAG: magnesium-translocating P-type ATPase, partial [Streptomycetaceae bacterium]|nr:magnesium-translocating P-type ATPase [Streptomycetaceae bacterium]
MTAAAVAAPAGLSSQEAAARLRRDGPNAVRLHTVRPIAVLARQVRNPLLGLLLAAALISAFVGEGTDATIIGVIVALSVGLGFVNEYRAERASQALHDRVRHAVEVVRDGRRVPVDVTALVVGDLVGLHLGTVIPADLRMSDVDGLECDESILTGESLPVAKHPGDAALMGTVVHRGTGQGIVTATAGRTQFGRLALSLGTRQPETRFQAGLRRFSRLLVVVAGLLTAAIFATNLLLRRPLLDALLFSLAIAVGITPQLLPAVVTTSLAAGSRRLARRGVLVKRLVCIEDLGDVDVLVTDKTGTLTTGAMTFAGAFGPAGERDDAVRDLALPCTERGDGPANPLDQALTASAAAQALPPAVADRPQPVALLGFDHERRMTSVLTDGPQGRRLITKGAPESVFAACGEVPDEARRTLDRLYADGARVLAVADRPATGDRLGPADERDLVLRGFLVFADPVKADAADAVARLLRLGVAVKIATGDSGPVAARVCADLRLPVTGVLDGAQVDTLDDDALAVAARGATVYARVSPEQKARLVRSLRGDTAGVAFLGDGVNDAVALHKADVGVSVDTAADVAKDAADVILLSKDLGVLADGVTDGRAIFAITIKYVLMGASSNFGYMFSAAGASAFLPFLPMLPSQILLNNLLYDSSQLAIPTDRVDPEQLAAPSHWDLRLIRRFMLTFGLASSIFDYLTFALMLGVFHAGESLFHTGWFVESLATQTLIIFAIRTRRTPFFRSRPGLLLSASALIVVAVGVLLPWLPIGGLLGFQPLPTGYLAALTGMVLLYLVVVEVTKFFFYRAAPAEPVVP